MKKTLHLKLKRKWFDMIKSGEKKEEYREINQYWFKRLVYDYKKVFKYCTGYYWDDDMFRDEGIDHITKSKQSMFGFVPFENNILKLGYPSKNDSDRILTFRHSGIEIKEGNPDWGAIPGKKYFVLELGDLV